MFPPKKILFPVDFSVRCTDAARMVETFSGHFQAELTLLHVVEPLTYNDVRTMECTIEFAEPAQVIIGQRVRLKIKL